MNISVDDLRGQLERELDDLGPAPDVLPAATRIAATRLRRRRALAGASLAMAAVVGVAVAVGALSGTDPAAERRGDVATDPSTPAPRPDPLADGTVTPAEWKETVRSTLASVLPERYGEVRVLPRAPHVVQYWGTDGGEPQLQLDVNVAGWHRSEDPSRRERDKGCAGLQQARELHDCAEATFGDGWLAVATVDLLPPGNGGSLAEGERLTLPPHDPESPPEDWSWGTVLTVMNDGVQVEVGVSELGWDGVEDNGPPGIGVDELVALAQQPAFLELVEVGARWWYDEPEPAPYIDPETGEEVPSITGEDQQVPPHVP